MPEINDTDYRLLVDAIIHLQQSQSVPATEEAMSHVRDALHSLTMLRAAIDHRESEKFDPKAFCPEPF